MRHAIIVAHPNEHSFTVAMAEAYAEAVEGLGHAVVRRDLYRIGFDPCLKPGELPFAAGWRPEPDVVNERGLLQDAHVFALFYPLWLNSPPAIMKGYLERVFGFGFAHGSGGGEPLLVGRKLISFTSSGSPLVWLRDTGMLEANRALFDRAFSQVCGMTLLDHVHSGSVTPGASGAFIAARQREVHAAVARHFTRAT